jgi:hypothetical protein
MSEVHGGWNKSGGSVVGIYRSVFAFLRVFACIWFWSSRNRQFPGIPSPPGIRPDLLYELFLAFPNVKDHVFAWAFAARFLLFFAFFDVKDHVFAWEIQLFQSPGLGVKPTVCFKVSEVRCAREVAKKRSLNGC